MTDVKPRSARESTSRRARAQRTRLRIAAAATELFATSGYTATTIEAVARKAGVAVQTVYFVFHTKPQLLVESIKIAGGGAEGASDVMDRAWIQEVVAAPDGGRRLALIAEHGTKIYLRLAPLWPAILAGLGEPDVREAWETVVRGRREGMARITGLMAARDELRPGLDADLAADILNGIHRHELFLALTRESAWSFDRYRAWTFTALCRELLPPDVAAAAMSAGSDAITGMELAAEVARFAT